MDPPNSVFQTYGSLVVERAFAQGKLDPHQVEAIQFCSEHLQSQHDSNASAAATAVLVLPTGTGKTPIALVLPYYLKSERVLIITPRDTLRNQMSVAAQGSVANSAHPERYPFLQEIGVLQANELHALGTIKEAESGKVVFNKLPATSLMLANAQIFTDRDGQARDDWKSMISPDFYDLVIIDEAHFHPAETWKRICDHFMTNKKCNIVFMTATPFRTDRQAVAPLEQFAAQFRRCDAVHHKVIRKVEFQEFSLSESAQMDDKTPERDLVLLSLMKAVKDSLDEHDKLFPFQGNKKHKALIMVGGGKAPSALAYHLEQLCGKSPYLKDLHAKAYCSGDRNPEKLKSGSSKKTKVASDSEDLAGIPSKPQKQSSSQREHLLGLFTNYAHYHTRMQSKSVTDLAPEPRVLIVNNMLREGFDHAYISVVAVARTFADDENPTFEQFIGRAVRVVRGAEPEGLTAKVIYHKYHGLGNMRRIFEEEKVYSPNARMICPQTDRPMPNGPALKKQKLKEEE